MKTGKTHTVKGKGKATRASDNNRPEVMVSEAAEPKSAPSPRVRFVVGVGASAGGLDALRNLLTNCQPLADVAIVIAQHLSPDRNSMLKEILQPKTLLKIRFATECQALEGATAYIIPPGTDAQFDDKKLYLVASSGEGIGPRPSVNKLFKTLAQCYQRNAVGIILSGTGTDGSQGLKAIREAGGVTLVQEIETAQYAGMPQAAIDLGAAEMILPPENMGPLIAELVSRGGSLEHPVARVIPEELMQRITRLMLERQKINLELYKQSTVLRRIDRRVQALQLADIEAYAAYFEQNPTEATHLSKELSIGVTSFFRDPSAFDLLRTRVAKLLETLPEGQQFRAWVPACSTGEEAFSLSMIIDDAYRKMGRPPDWVLFATDVNQHSVNRARLGIYDRSILNHIPPEFVDSYLDLTEERATVRKSLRQNIIFATHDILVDPPFSRLNCITCRNLLIYLKPGAQRQVLSMLHYSLQAAGLLMLGQAETPDAFSDLFEPLDQRARIFERSERQIKMRALGASFAGKGESRTKDSLSSENTEQSAIIPRRQVEQDTRTALCDQFAPPTIVVDENDRIIHFVGDLAPFVNLPRGPADWLAADLVRPPMNVEIRAMLHRARRSEAVVQGDRYTFDVSGTTKWVRPKAFLTRSAGTELTLLAFECQDIPPPKDGQADTAGSEQRLIEELQRELTDTREHLQSVIEEVETTNEELQTLNEELQSSNEELQSTNEELQTSNEELQSTNEELTNVNIELAERSIELETSQADLLNVKESLGIGILVLDSSLTVSQFNQNLLRFLSSPSSFDVGGNVATINWLHPLPGMADSCVAILNGAEPISRVTNPAGGLHIQTSFTPYIRGSKVAGVVIRVEDVSASEEQKSLLRQREALFRLMFESDVSGMIVLDSNGATLRSNRVIESLLGVTNEELRSQPLTAFLHPEDLAVFRSMQGALLNGSNARMTVEARLSTTDTKWIWCNITAAVMGGAGDPVDGIVMQIQDISARRTRQKKLVDEYTQLRVLHAMMRKVAGRVSKDELLDALFADLSVLFGDRRISLLERESPTSFKVARVVSPSDWKAPPGRSIEFSGRSTYLRRLSVDHIMRVNELPDDSVPEAIHHEMLAQGVNSWIDAAIKNRDDLSGILRIESREPNTWTDADADLLQGISDVLFVAQRDQSAQDLTHRHIAELGEMKQRAEHALDGVSDAVLITDALGSTIFLNKSAEELFEAPRVEATGKPFFKITKFVSGESEFVNHPIEACLRDGIAVRQSDQNLLLKVGSREIRVIASASPIPSHADSSELCGAILVVKPVCTS